MIFSARQYCNAVVDYNRTWRTTDQTLYDLCRQHPEHNCQAGVNAKLWIIGRTYATGIERKITSNGKQGGSMSQLADHLFKNADKMDALFTPLMRLKEPLEQAKLRTILDIHGRFIVILLTLPMLRENQLPRSFASKYMHFHCSAVPIIDTYAVRACRKLIRWKTSLTLFKLPAAADEQYAQYVFRFWQLYQQARTAGLQPNVKHLDRYLLRTEESKA